VTRRHTYAAAERFILSREFFGMKLGLQNISDFLESIGTPQLKYDTIHLAGTNGKGSTAAMLDSVLRAAGYKVGLFTSPHLVDFRERIKVNGEKIDRRAIIAFVDKHRRQLTKAKLSFFELVTALALNHFARKGVDIAVMETGLGGRLDATNVLSPLLTVTTDISKDHVEILGSTIRQIAREKAGIIKPGVPHLIGMLPETALDVMQDVCRKQGSPLYRLRRADFVPHTSGMSLDFRSNGLSFRGLSPSLVGTHQLTNTALVLKAIEILKKHTDLSLSKSAVKAGLTHTVCPGRFRIIERKSMPTVVLDVCHNAGGIAAFADSFRRKFPGRKAFMVAGFVKRKPHQQMFDLLSGVSAGYYLVPLKTKRSTDTSEMLSDIKWRGVPARKFGSVTTAYNKLLKLCGPDDIITIIGSHYLVGEFLKLNGW